MSILHSIDSVTNQRNFLKPINFFLKPKVKKMTEKTKTGFYRCTNCKDHPCGISHNDECKDYSRQRLEDAVVLKTQFKPNHSLIKEREINRLKSLIHSLCDEIDYEFTHEEQYDRLMDAQIEYESQLEKLKS